MSFVADGMQARAKNAAVDVTMCSVGETVLKTLFPCCCRRWRFLVCLHVCLVTCLGIQDCVVWSWALSDSYRVVPLSNRGYLCSDGMRLQRGLMSEVYTVLGRSIVARLWMTSTG